MARRRARIGRALGAAAAALLALSVAACAPEPDAAPPVPTDAASATPRPTLTPVAIADFPFGPSTSTTPLPSDCESILTPGIRASLEGIPLNAPGMGGGIRPDSSRVCVWADPGASRTSLVTVVGYSPERDARDALYLLGVDDGYLCYEPDHGLRCEKSGKDALGLSQGRTVFWRDGVAIDTQYRNLAPQGYTDGIVKAIWG